MFIPPGSCDIFHLQGDANAFGSDAAGRAARLAREMEIIQGHVERTLMICEALWSILKEKHGYTDTELFKRVAEIDLKDGRLDGKVAAEPPDPCPHCDRPMSRGKMICLYCGKPVQIDLFKR